MSDRHRVSQGQSRDPQAAIANYLRKDLNLTILEIKQLSNIPPANEYPTLRRSRF
ncbi:MAG: hypothetical protein SAL07_25045 [Oscillatoria sp. PMC 1051.18]|uniref:hypothetical protein n=1 Tax=Oscillatoria salina TaxID=331517 RepID=UPI0013B6997B|nr:hypothetical protein [Oscillatoria salina]MBZ8179658.1 hypothetical protein [Oscillatoria salina IIICB1]MEC5033158.1 hypothetical protein [Oscillatoria sp. PMC 1051.18]MEC5033174.1 hypothetical protein [Oscillatoria sp. PMC 1051.18]NET89255.1 hypothetical protein [Kamptonema sp. SIO1D9]